LALPRRLTLRENITECFETVSNFAHGREPPAINTP
jgi:hypothetical protein